MTFDHRLSGYQMSVLESETGYFSLIFWTCVERSYRNTLSLPVYRGNGVAGSPSLLFMSDYLPYYDICRFTVHTSLYIGYISASCVEIHDVSIGNNNVVQVWEQRQKENLKRGAKGSTGQTDSPAYLPLVDS